MFRNLIGQSSVSNQKGIDRLLSVVVGPMRSRLSGQTVVCMIMTKKKKKHPPIGPRVCQPTGQRLVCYDTSPALIQDVGNACRMLTGDSEVSQCFRTKSSKTKSRISFSFRNKIDIFLKFIKLLVTIT